MIDVLRDWFRTWFSDQEAVYLFLVLAGGLLVVMFMGRMLAPAITALVLAYLLQGLVNALRRRGMGERSAVLLVYLLFVAVLVSVLGVLLPMVWKQTLNLVQFQLPRLLSGSEAWLQTLPERYPEIVSAAQVEQLVATARRELAQAGQSLLSGSLASIPELVQAMVFLVLVPLLFSEAVNLHPVAIILAILVFGGIWGFWGVFFAIPLATLLKAALHAWPRSRPDPEVAADAA